MNNTFFYKDKKEITPDLSETARYLGYKKSAPPEENIQKLIEKAAIEIKKIMTPQGVYEIFPLEITPKENLEKAQISFADVTITTHDLYKNLKGCTKVALLGATIGPQVDTYIRKAQILDPVYASICQATGAMYIEEVVNNLNEEIKNQAAKEGYKTRPRYSPGYGDIPLTAQKDFFRLLNCQRIGLTLMPTLIMAPEKSVTAYIGFYKS